METIIVTLLLRLGVATAASPNGPFSDVFDHPMFDFGYAAIDGHVLLDDDGRKYFYYECTGPFSQSHAQPGIVRREQPVLPVRA